MVAPIVVYRPKLILQPLDENLNFDGASVDVSCDMSSVELTVDTPTADVSTFCGHFTIPDDPVPGATFEFTINADTDDNWSALVGKTVEAQVYDKETDTRYRKFQTTVLINPSLYGPTTPGESRTFSADFAVLSAVEWDEES